MHRHTAANQRETAAVRGKERGRLRVIGKAGRQGRDSARRYGTALAAGAGLGAGELLDRSGRYGNPFVQRTLTFGFW